MDSFVPSESTTKLSYIYYSQRILVAQNVSESEKTTFFSKKEKYLATAVMMYTHFAFVSANYVHEISVINSNLLF
jgi:hypothetical protein